MLMPAAGSRAKADERRLAVLDAAIVCFARKGFYGTTTHEVAEQAEISQPYLYRLYVSKETLFAHAVDKVSDLMTKTLTAHAPRSAHESKSVHSTLEAARTAYTDLVADRVILRFLMHANCAAEEPLIADAVRRCYAKQVETIREFVGDDDLVRRWFGAGMLDNVVAVLGLADLDEPWAQVLSNQ